MKTYFGFALASGMFVGNCTISRRLMEVAEVKEALAGENLVSCVNKSHIPTIEAAKTRFGLEVPVPETPPTVKTIPGDRVIVMGVSGLPRLVDRHEYTPAEIEGASFEFVEYLVS